MEKSKHLHNFNLPPALMWGTQKVLRCMNVNPVHDDQSSDSGNETEGFHNIDDGRKRLRIKLKSPSLSSKPSKQSPKICTEDHVVDPRSEKKSTRPRRNIEKKKEEERPKFSIALSRKEIEEDFIAMTGKKPPRKPNKRSKNLQTKLDAVFPGSWLCEIHPDQYKLVNENG